MSNTKAIPKQDVEKLIADLEKKLVSIKELSNEQSPFGAYKALGYAEGALEHLIKQLKGDYPIF